MMTFLLSAIGGLLLGSFANVCIFRLPNEESICFPGSKCPSCGSSIRYFDNVPVLSYGWLKGRCRSCKTRIPLQYPIVECASAALLLINAAVLGTSWPRLILADVLSIYLLIITVIDFQHRIIPDELSLSLLVLGLTVAAFNPFFAGSWTHKLLESALAASAGLLSMLALAWAGEKIFRQEALGGGDIKLVAAFGAVLGWAGLVGPIFIGSLTGSSAGVLLILTGKKGRKETIPFGPFLSLGAFVTCLLPPGWLSRIFP